MAGRRGFFFEENTHRTFGFKRGSWGKAYAQGIGVFRFFFLKKNSLSSL
jgi:hypothetical protein